MLIFCKSYHFIIYFLIIFYFSCSEPEPEDCAEIINGSSVCGCTDSNALNYDSIATFDDGSCPPVIYANPNPITNPNPIINPDPSPSRALTEP